MANINNRRIVFMNAILVGFFGGVFLAIVQLIFHYFNVSKVSHIKVLSIFHIQGSWIDKWYGYFFFISFIGVLSIVVTFIYYLLFKRFRSWLPGAFFGLGLWVLVGLLIPFQLYELSFTSFYKSNTNVVSFSSLLLYGIFIGYSISYDEEMRKYEPEKR